MFDSAKCRNALLAGLKSSDQMGSGRMSEVLINSVELRAYLNAHSKWVNHSTSGREVFKASSGVTVTKTGNGSWMIARDF